MPLSESFARPARRTHWAAIAALAGGRVVLGGAAHGHGCGGHWSSPWPWRARIARSSPTLGLAAVAPADGAGSAWGGIVDGGAAWGAVVYRPDATKLCSDRLDEYRLLFATISNTMRNSVDTMANYTIAILYGMS